MKKLGIKIWTRDVVKNRNFFEQAVAAVKNKDFDYLELFVFPNSYNDTAEVIRRELKGCPTIIHNSHSAYGFDAGDADCLAGNLRDVGDSQKFADMLNAEIIIVHAGCGCEERHWEETIRQFKRFDDKRIAVENMPASCSVSGKALHGVFPEQIERIMSETGCKFCLDFSHATCAANYYGRRVGKILEDFAALKPDMYHLCDGMADEVQDKHLHFGEGNYDLAHMVNDIVAEDAYVTMETGYKPPVDIKPWLDDRDYFRKLCG